MNKTYLKCTPGAVNPNVHQDNIATTICQPEWTKTVRPPTSVTNKIKLRIDQAYGLPTNTQANSITTSVLAKCQGTPLSVGRHRSGGVGRGHLAQDRPPTP